MGTSGLSTNGTPIAGSAGAFSGAGASVSIGIDECLWIFNRSGGQVIFTVQLRWGNLTQSVTLADQKWVKLSGIVYVAATPNGLNANTTWCKGPPGTFDIGTLRLSSFSDAVVVSGSVAVTNQFPLTVVDTQMLAPISVAGGTAETVGTAGAVNIPLGASVDFVLTANELLTTPADNLSYVGLKGATSGTYYAVLLFGAGSGLAGTIHTSLNGEKLNIVYKNADTGAHACAAYWVAYST